MAALFRPLCRLSVAIPFSRHVSSSSPSRATLSTTPPAHQTVLIQTPSPEFIATQELDVALPPKEDAKLIITDRAAEQLRSISTRISNTNAALRVAVESGGCHGYQYKMELANSRLLDDYHFTHPIIKPSNILVDAVSFQLINGSTIDYATELIGSSFRMMDNPQAKGSGCGCGVSWELKE